MQTQEPRSTELIDPIPKDVESAQAKLVYCYLAVAGGATVDDIERTLGMKKLDLLSVLQSLTGAELVEKRDSEYVTVSSRAAGGEA